MPTDTMIVKRFDADISVVDGERAVVGAISTQAVDRVGDVVIAQGCDAKDFLKNPVVFFDHQYHVKAIAGKCVAFRKEKDRIIAKTMFARRPDNHQGEWLPDVALALMQQGIIKGFSIGFDIGESRPATRADIAKFGEDARQVISKWKMLEYSIVPIPCNQDALALAVSKGIVTPASVKALTGADPPEYRPAPTPVPTRKRRRVIVVVDKPPVAATMDYRRHVDDAIALAQGRIY